MAKMKALRGKVSELERAAAQRKAKLDENSAFLQFNWKADVVESWIGELMILYFMQMRRNIHLKEGLPRNSVIFSFHPYNLSLALSGEKENSLKTDDYGRDLSSVQTLLTKQV